MSSLKNKTILITGASRGIGREIALRAAKDGANVVIAAKSVVPHPKLPGTVQSVVAEVEALGARALGCKLDVREDESIAEVIRQIESTFGGLDILINNASAISMTDTEQTPMKRFDLMFSVNVRGTFACSQACLPLLKKAENPHILNLSPPLSMEQRWFQDHVAYTMSKYGMSMCTLGMSGEFKKYGIAVNSLWPRTTIATAAIEYNFPKEVLDASRLPAIVADAAHAILMRNAREFTGNFCVDELILRESGVKDFAHYAVNREARLFPDLFLTE